jgi:hypothetical protein
MARMSTTAAIAGLDAILATLNTGGAGTLKVFSGAAPANCEAADSGTLLAELTLAVDAWGNASDGVNQATATSGLIGQDLAANAAGIPGYFRMYDGAGTCHIQGTAGGPASGTEIEFDKSPFALDDTVKITAGLTATLSEGS